MSINDFHKQQQDLFQQFKQLREKYNEHQENMREVLWKWLPENHDKLKSIPPIASIIENNDRVGL